MELSANLVPLIAFVAAIVQFLRRLNIPGDYLPFISIGVAMGLTAVALSATGVAYAAMDVLMGGFTIGLAASGSARAVKSMGKLNPGN